jgi:putative tryptophan/tyrosine transport system substrate-binding protein
MRRGVVWLLVGVVLVSWGPAAGRAQPRRLVKIGALTQSWGPTPAIIGLRDGLTELGYRENQDFVIGIRFTQGNPSELPAAVRDLLRHGVDVIVTSEAGDGAKVARAATTRIPIVFIGGIDPVKLGLVQSLARPGGNVTGIADLGIDLIPKRIETFQQTVPTLKRVLFAYDAADVHTLGQLDVYRETTRGLGLTLVEKPVRTQEEAQAVLAALRRDEIDGILSPQSLALNIPGFILQAGSRLRIPTMFHATGFVEEGGLVGYSPSTRGLGRQAARLVDRILKGAKPADLPVEHPTTFELTLNLKTAAALGLTIPQPVLVRADRLIE